MISFDKLKTYLQTQQAATKEVSLLDFDQITNAVEAERLSEAIPKINASFEQGIFDIRLIVYHLYIHFREQGIKSFNETLPFLSLLLENHFEILLPLSKREKNVENSLNWFFSHVLKKVKYFEKNRQDHPVWSTSVASFSTDALQTLLRSATHLKEVLHQRWPNSEMRLLHLVKDLEALKYFIEQPTEKEADVLTISESNTEAEAIEEKPQIKISETPPNLASLDSEMMRNLKEKLNAFSSLMAKGDYFKAALVSKDINHQIEHFDPSLYFPKLFSQYFGLLVQQGSSLIEEWEKEKSLHWEYLEKLYRSNLQEFLDLKLP